jgi:hypothetical protein
MVAAGLAWAQPLNAGADPGGFDILGVKLGMTAEEVRTVAGANGLTEKRSRPAPSFDQAVALELRKRVAVPDYVGVRKIEFSGGREFVTVFFVPTRTGSRTEMINYGFFGSGVTASQMAESVLEKYGNPDQDGERTWVWGDTATYHARRNPFLEYDRSPVKAFGPETVGKLTLADPQLKRASQDQIAQAAAERATGEKPRF